MPASSHADRSRPLLTDVEVAALLAVDRRTVGRWADRGAIRRVRVGGAVRYVLPAEVARVLRDEEVIDTRT